MFSRRNARMSRGRIQEAYVAAAAGASTPEAIAGSDAWQVIDERSFTLSTIYVSALTDMTGRGRNYSAASTQQPIYEAGGWNGQPSMAFDFSNDFFTDTNSGALANEVAGGGTVNKGFITWFECQYFALSTDSALWSMGNSAGSTPYLEFVRTSTNQWAISKNSGTTKTPISAANADTLRHWFKFKFDGTTGSLYKDGNATAIASIDFTTSTGPTFNKDVIGALGRSTTSVFFNGRMRGRTFAKTTLSAGAEASMDAYYTTRNAAQTAPMLLVNGDSLSTPTKWQANFVAAYPSATVVNTAVAGQTLFGYGGVWVARDQWSNYDSARSGNVLVTAFGSNDIVNAQTGASIYANTQTLVTAETSRNVGRKIVVSTIGWRSGLTASEETERQAFNTSIRADKAGAHYLLDVDLILPASETTTFKPDGTHPDATGNTHIWNGRNGSTGLGAHITAAGGF